jgi:hypothetical protein
VLPKRRRRKKKALSMNFPSSRTIKK